MERNRCIALACLAVMLLTSGLSRADEPPENTLGKRLAQAELAIANDHPRAEALLQQLHREQGLLDPQQRHLLDFLTAREADLGGQSSRAHRIYTRLLSQVHSRPLLVRTRAALIAMDLRERKYLEAYTQANTLISELPDITDTRIRTEVLYTMIRVSVAQHQYDEAMRYADEMLASTSSAQAICKARAYRSQIRIYRNEPTPAIRGDYEQAVRSCMHAGLIGNANALRLDWASRMIDDGHPDRAIAFVHEIAPDIQRAGFQIHVTSLHVTLAMAYLKKGQFARARAEALTALKDNGTSSYNWTLQSAYDVLYRVAEHDGNDAAALDAYKNYVAQANAASDDAKAQALAFQMIKQKVLEKKLRLEELGKQNRILQLRQSLDRKSAENARLYILMLLIVLTFLGFWAYRTKHSQIRFRRMARHDSLTGVFTRAHFMEQAERILERLNKAGSPACLLILDMDHFKRVNDRYGHICGDVVLKHVARLCQKELRSSDLYGRLGGEEFGILMPSCTANQGAEIGERIRHTMAGSSVHVCENESVTVTASIGLACTDDCGYTLRSLLVRADAAQYEAKRNGRNRLVIGQTGSATSMA